MWFLLCRPLKIIYKSCLERESFYRSGKKIILSRYIRKKINSWWTLSYIPTTYGKTYYTLPPLFNFLHQSDLISPAQSGLRSGDSCIDQLLPITLEIYQSMDAGYETRGVFLGIFKSHKLWHEDHVFKLKQNWISGNLLNILEDFLKK